MSMYHGVPPHRQEQFEQFMAAYANTSTVMNAVRTWIDEMPTRKGLAANEITAPPHAWLSERTGLTDGMLATTLIALFASGGIQPHPHKRDVWLLAGEGDLDPEPARERLLTVLDIITASGHHMTPLPTQPRRKRRLLGLLTRGRDHRRRP
ncbi:hypothetical protein [Streptomyces mutabilis]|uniref:hypothetical protein n=1 Tax=Streptomyces mutabilis TaxID=67332 RepID=UPI0036AB4C94